MKHGLTQGLRRALQARHGSVAIIDGERRLDWAEFVERVSRLAGALRALGVGEGDRVALLAMNSHRSVEIFFGILWAGGVAAPLSHRLTVPELEARIIDAEPKVLIVGDDFVSEAPALRAAGNSIRSIILCEAADGLDGMLGYEELLASSAPIEDANRGGDDLACLFYTGGTTGAAKGVMLSHANIQANSVNFIAHLGLDERLVHLHCGPLFHVAAAVRLFSATQVGGTHVVLSRFSALEVLETIERERVTLATFVPTMLRALLDQPALKEFDLSSLEVITYGAAPMPESLLREVMAALPAVRFVQSYGMTETSPIITMLGWRDHLPDAASNGLLRSAGKAALLAEVRVVNDRDEPVAPGERGEIVARGPMVMLGYWRNQTASAEALRGGWMHTGDIGFLDDGGYLYVVDRLKDIIISGGENIYSQEVENAIASHPAVAQCAVFGRPDPKWGEAVHAVVALKPAATLSPNEVIAHAKSRLASFKCPRSVEIRAEPLPLSGANKILKNQLRAELLAGSSGGAT